MKQPILIIDAYKPIYLLPDKFPNWFNEINDPNDKLRVSKYIIDSLILITIDSLTSHKVKLFKDNDIIYLNDQEYNIDFDEIINTSISDIFPGIIELNEYIYNDPWFVYSVTKIQSSRIIAPLYDWRVKEYYRLTNQIDYDSICIEEWSDDPLIINRFIEKHK
jgi:hypothetical protein